MRRFFSSTIFARQWCALIRLSSFSAILLLVACLDIGRIAPSQTGTMTTPVAAILDKCPATALTTDVHFENKNNKLLQSATILGRIFFSLARPLLIIAISLSERPVTECSVLEPFLTPMMIMMTPRWRCRRVDRIQIYDQLGFVTPSVSGNIDLLWLVEMADGGG